MKKIAIILSILLLCLAGMAGAETVPFPDMGLALDLPLTAPNLSVQLAGDNNTYTGIVVFYINEEAIAPYAEAYEQAAAAGAENLAEVEAAYSAQLEKHSRLLGSVIGFRTELLPMFRDDLTDAVKVGANSAYTYFRMPGVSETELAEEDLPLLEAAIPEAQRFMEAATVIELVSDASRFLRTFTTTDLAGNAVDASVFAQADLTVFHVWATFCGPCIREMPDLAAWEKELPENVQVIGLVVDVSSPEDKTYQQAEKILTKSGAEFPNLITSESLQPFSSLVTGVPTTFFLDRDGQPVGEPVTGAYLDTYKQRVEDFLKK